MAYESFVEHVARQDSLVTQIALQRERLDLRIRGKYRDCVRQATANSPAVPGEFPRSHAVRLVMHYPALLGVVAAALFALGPRLVLAGAVRAVAIWRAMAPLRL